NGTSWGTSQPMAAAKNSQVREQQVETGNSQRPQTERRNEAGSLDKSAGSENAIGGQDQAAITQKRAFPQSVQQESIAGKAAGGASQNAVGNQSLGNEGLAGNAYGRASGVYVCQMSRRQAEVLSNSISRDELKLQAGTTATLNSNTFNLATTAPAPQSNGLADAAQNQSANNVYGYRARAMLRDATPAGGELQMKQSAGARAGAPLTLTTTQPATAEGLRKSGAGAFYIEQPIRLAGAASGPTTQPAPSTQPAEAQVGQAAPTTQPAEEPVNVVILVEATPPAAAGSPANAPPSAPAAAVPATSQPSQPADSAK
ncbi:MAG TPA: hypothetical protein VLJ39_21120, partial [Tepidisphaeraceae bacterium]|nr:hypothetical protein [Tepidisphaeraceae bacterium]